MNIEQIEKASADIVAERQRQVSEEKWTPEHDDQHVDGSLWRAAFFYANMATAKYPTWAYINFRSWPWSPEWFKPWKKNPDGTTSTAVDPERCLIKAGALILAEQERLVRSLQKVIDKLAEVQNQKSNVP